MVRVLIAAGSLSLMASPLLAQTAQPAQPAKPATPAQPADPAASQPATAAEPATPAEPAAAASTTSAITVGSQVTDAKGGAVGTVTAVANGVVTVKTDKLDAKLDAKSFTPKDGKLLISMTQAELNAAVEKQNAAASAEVKAGLTVKDKAGAAAGTVEAVDAETVTIKLPSGKSVRVPRKGVGASADGAVVGLTLAELEANAKAPAKAEVKPKK